MTHVLGGAYEAINLFYILDFSVSKVPDDR
jgi:hypothetical protein